MFHDGIFLNTQSRIPWVLYGALAGWGLLVVVVVYTSRKKTTKNKERQRRREEGEETEKEREREREREENETKKRERNRVVCHWTPHLEFAFDDWNLRVLLFCCCRCCCSPFFFFVLLLSFLDCSCQRDLWRKNDDEEAVEKNACRRRR
jgi:hypothetical protein